MTTEGAPFGEVLTAMITPFHGDGSVDFDAVDRLAKYLVTHGSDGIVVTGTTGESPTLTNEEKRALYSAVVAAVGERAVVIAGTGTYDTAESIELSKAAADLGCDGVMAVTPYYSKPGQPGLLAHFTAIADATDLPLLVYNIPGRTSRLIEVGTLAQLAEHPNIVATKDAVMDLDFTTKTRMAAPADFAIYSGQDSYTVPMMSVGAVGVVSVASHVIGRQVKASVEAATRGDLVEARRLHLGMADTFYALFVETNPAPVKAALNELWGSVGGVRLPLTEASGTTTLQLVEAIGKAQTL